MFSQLKVLAPLLGQIKKQYNVVEREVRQPDEIGAALRAMAKPGDMNLYVTAQVNGMEIRAFISAPEGALSGVIG